jgi:predicted signal transduction protein with EAL and GGDEF domain
VEASIQVDRLRELACDAAQGYYLGRPMDRELMTGWLQRDALIGATAQQAAEVPGFSTSRFGSTPEGRPYLRAVGRSGLDR